MKEFQIEVEQANRQRYLFAQSFQGKDNAREQSRKFYRKIEACVSDKTPKLAQSVKLM